MSSNKEIFTTMLERDIGNLYGTLKAQIFNIIPEGYRKIALNMYASKEPEIIDWLQTQSDMIVETVFLNPEISIEDATEKASDLIRDMLEAFMNEKLGLSELESGIVRQLFVR